MGEEAAARLDGLLLKVRHCKQVTNRCTHGAPGLNLRGKKDIHVTCMDGLKALSEAATAPLPRLVTQQCVAHLVRTSMRYGATKDMKAVAVALKRICTSATIEDAPRELEGFEEEWGENWRATVRAWRGAWPSEVPVFQFRPEIRKTTYATNTIESFNMTMRKYMRNRRIFPNDESAMKSPYRAIRETSKRWRCAHHWKSALQIQFGEERAPISGQNR